MKECIGARASDVKEILYSSHVLNGCNGGRVAWPSCVPPKACCCTKLGTNGSQKDLIKWS
jgi:hypothetical protein